MKRLSLIIALTTICFVAGFLVWSPVSEAQEGAAKFRRAQDAVFNQYIVVLKRDIERSSVNSVSQKLVTAHGGQVRFTYEHALKGFSVMMSEQEALQLSKDPLVEFVEENGKVSINTMQYNPPWGIDRIDQRYPPLNGVYTYDNTGTGVNAYVIDTGIRATHMDFNGRAVAAADFAPPDEGGGGGGGGCSSVPPIICGSSLTSENQEASVDVTTNSDCNGHGTHVAATLGGTTYGVAKNVRIFGVRVLNCSGSGTYESVIAGVNWVTAHHNSNPGPAVANMSLGGGADAGMDVAVRDSIASGVTYVVAAGNGDFYGNGIDASNVSPARVLEAITVGATDITDRRANFSNFGSLVDVHAPGVNVLSAWNTSDTATNTISGTSMASPHVAGVAALYLQTYRTASPTTVQAAIVNNATTGVLSNIPGGTANRLLFSRFFPPEPTKATSTDFDGDGRSDIAVWRPDTGVWYISNSAGNGGQWGLQSLGDKIVPGDYDGDSKVDLAVWRAPEGRWYILSSSTGATRYETFGLSDDIPVPADYDGDGKTDVAVFRPSTGTWIIMSSSTSQVRYETFGQDGDKPVPADFDGDGKTDIAVFRSSNGTWYIVNSSNRQIVAAQFGLGDDVPVPADYDGDNRADIVVFRPSDGTWYVRRSDGSFYGIGFGQSGDIPVPADYDGDNRADIAVFRPLNGTWYVRRADSTFYVVGFGQQGDVPIPSAYNR